MHHPLGPGMMQQIQSVWTDCGGSGIKVTHCPLGPGMMQQIQSVCTHCGGSGDYIRYKDKSKKCKGKRLVEINHKQENTAGDDHSDKQLDHTDYRRVDCDLFVEEHQFKGGLVWLHLHSVPPGREERGCVQVTRSSAVTRSWSVSCPQDLTHQHWTQRQRKWI
ncbi:uncharacterized protein LOC135340767 isoform X2 [Halichondria panicea]|uniref:uncharacterized protein LOC135340767 isoform X2 n=1 Tax=Halichondria panicea TaxID=6063 RepID=UPI00312B98B8